MVIHILEVIELKDFKICILKCSHVLAEHVNSMLEFSNAKYKRNVTCAQDFELNHCVTDLWSCNSFCKI